MAANERHYLEEVITDEICYECKDEANFCCHECNRLFCYACQDVLQGRESGGWEFCSLACLYKDSELCDVV